MTNEEAMIALEVHLSLGHARKEREVTLLAIKALEKQIPKKLKRSEAEGIGFCSGCGTLIRYDKYCRNCGQRTEIKEQKNEPRT